MSIFRFTLDDYTILEDQPKGWDEMELKVVRDTFTIASYVTYMSDLTFWGEGWNHCSYVLKSQGLCGQVTVKVEVDRLGTGHYKTLFVGVMNFTDAEIDYEKCTVKCKVKQNTMMKYISDRYDYGVWYFNNFFEVGKMRTFNGNDVIFGAGELNSCARSIILHDVVTGDQPGTAMPYFTDNYGYRVIDVLNYHMAILTDNKVSVVSDFFTKQSFQPEQYQITISSGTMTGGDIVTVVFDNMYGNTFTIEVPFDTSDLQTLTNIGERIVQRGDFSLYFNSLATLTADETAAMAYSYYDGSKFSYTEADAMGPVLLAESCTPITNITITCSNPAVVFTVNKVQELKYGMKNLFMGFNNELGNNNTTVGNKIVSFRSIFEKLDSHFDLGILMQQVDEDKWEMRIEPKSDIFNQPQILDLGGVIGITSSPNQDISIQNLSVGTKGANTMYRFKAASGRKQQWFVNQCQSEVRDKDTEANYDIATVGFQYPHFSQGYNIKYGDDITFFTVTDETVNNGLKGSGSQAVSEFFRLRVMNSHSYLDPSQKEGILYAYNVPMINGWAVYNHLYSLTGDAKSPVMNPELFDNILPTPTSPSSTSGISAPYGAMTCTNNVSTHTATYAAVVIGGAYYSGKLRIKFTDKGGALIGVNVIIGGILYHIDSITHPHKDNYYYFGFNDLQAGSLDTDFVVQIDLQGSTAITYHATIDLSRIEFSFGSVYTISNSEDSKMRRNYEFDSLLTDDQVGVIAMMPHGQIGFSKSGSDQLIKSIYEMTFNCNTGKTHFKLFG